MNNVLFLSMDGVLSDFVKQASNRTQLPYVVSKIDARYKNGRSAQPLSLIEQNLKRVLKNYCLYDDDFWRSMPIKEGACDLFWNLKKRFSDIRILSRLSVPEEAKGRLSKIRQLKKEWFLNNIDASFDPNKILVTDRPKEFYMFAQGHSVLIDPKVSNVNAWMRFYMRNANMFSKGASGFVFVNKEQILDDLTRKGFNEKAIASQQPTFTFICLKQNEHD